MKMKQGVQIALTLMLGLSISACDQLIGLSVNKIFELQMIELCGEDDAACIKAVETQLPGCSQKYKKENDAFMSASADDENGFAEIYLTKLYGCVVDEEGNSYFEYAPE